jgi:hypothetical protein
MMPPLDFGFIFVVTFLALLVVLFVGHILIWYKDLRSQKKMDKSNHTESDRP